MFPSLKMSLRNRSVTMTIKKHKRFLVKHAPEMTIRDGDKFEIIKRPPMADPQYFGYFTEYAFRYYNGLDVERSSRKYLTQMNPCDTRLSHIFDKPDKNIMHVCELSFSEFKLRRNFNNSKARDLYNEITFDMLYYENYFRSLPFKINQEKPVETLEYDGLEGAPDIITDDSIIELKCCKKDDVDYFRLQLYLYSYLYFKSTGIKISKCEAYNFMTGNKYTMEFGDFTEEFIFDLSKC